MKYQCKLRELLFFRLESRNTAWVVDHTNFFSTGFVQYTRKNIIVSRDLSIFPTFIGEVALHLPMGRPHLMVIVVIGGEPLYPPASSRRSRQVLAAQQRVTTLVHLPLDLHHHLWPPPPRGRPPRDGPDRGKSELSLLCKNNLLTNYRVLEYKENFVFNFTDEPCRPPA